MQEFDLIIVGGGLAGASLAVALRDSPLRLALVENQPPQLPATDSLDRRIYAINPASANFLAQIGAWKHLNLQRMARLDSMQIFGDAGGRLEFTAYEAGLDTLGWIVESSQIAGELWEILKRQSNLTCFCPASPAALHLDESSAKLTLADGLRLAARLIVAADGRDSWIRRHVGLKAALTAYGEKGVVANFSCELAHHHTARQWFRSDGVLAWLPLPEQAISIVWSTPDAEADRLCALPADEFAATVAAAGRQTLGKLELLSQQAAFPLALLRVPQSVAPRIALIGDAAHGIHPLSGHGINLGFADARELSRLLGSAAAWQDIGALGFLARYQRARREETLLLQTATDGLHRLFHSRIPGADILRNFGLNATNALPIVKTALVRYACGLL